MKVTGPQKGALEWALEAMISVTDCEGGEEEFGYTKSQIPVIRGSNLDITNSNEDAIVDLVYRIKEQLPDMAAEQGYSDGTGNKYATIGMCKRLGQKIEEEWSLRTAEKGGKNGRKRTGIEAQA